MLKIQSARQSATDPQRTGDGARAVIHRTTAADRLAQRALTARALLAESILSANRMKVARAHIPLSDAAELVLVLDELAAFARAAA